MKEQILLQSWNIMAAVILQIIIFFLFTGSIYFFQESIKFNYSDHCERLP